MSRIARWFVLAACLGGTAPADDLLPDRGADLLAPFKQSLQRALRAGMADGPVAAIGACRDQAPDIAAGLSKNGIVVGRSSHKLRNPANAAPDWVAPVLEAYVSDAGNRMPQTVTLDDSRAGYVEPITVQPLCLSCHGEAIAEDLRMRIDELYPEDRATGFKAGDLRGVFWVAYPAAQDERR